MSRIADPSAKLALLRAAEQVFAEHGPTGARVEEIAHRAGLSKGAFYLHFESKEAALRELVESFLAQCQSSFAPPAECPVRPDDLLGTLDFALARDVKIYEFLWQNRAFLRILPRCQGTYDYLLVAFRAEIAETAREWVDHWRREGVYREEVDAELASSLIGGAYNELSLRLIGEERRPPFESWLRFAQETFFRAYGTPAMLAAIEQRNRGTSVDTDVAEVRSRTAPRRRRPRADERGRPT